MIISIPNSESRLNVDADMRAEPWPDAEPNAHTISMWHEDVRLVSQSELRSASASVAAICSSRGAESSSPLSQMHMATSLASGRRALRLMGSPMSLECDGVASIRAAMSAVAIVSLHTRKMAVAHFSRSDIVYHPS